MKEARSLKFESYFWKTIEIIVLILFGLMIVVVCYQILCRDFLKIAATWTEEIARWCFIWVIFLGSAWAMKGKHHIRVTVLYENFSFKVKTIFNIISDIISFTFLGSICWGAIEMMKTTKVVSASSFNVKTSYLYLALLIGMGLMIFLKLREIFLEKINI